MLSLEIFACFPISLLCSLPSYCLTSESSPHFSSLWPSASSTQDVYKYYSYLQNNTGFPHFENLQLSPCRMIQSLNPLTVLLTSWLRKVGKWLFPGAPGHGLFLLGYHHWSSRTKQAAQTLLLPTLPPGSLPLGNRPPHSHPEFEAAASRCQRRSGAQGQPGSRAAANCFTRPYTARNKDSPKRGDFVKNV